MRLRVSDIVGVVGAEVRGGGVSAAVSGADSVSAVDLGSDAGSDLGSKEITSMVFDARKLWGWIDHRRCFWHWLVGAMGTNL